MVSIPSTKAILQEQQAEQESATLINLSYGFFQCPDAVLQAKGLSWRARCIYARLLCYAREKETCFPGQARLAVDLGTSVDTIQRGLRELKDYGLIRWRRRGLTKTNVYTIVKLSEVEALKNNLSPKPHAYYVKKPRERGHQKPQTCGTNEMQPNGIQVESDEALSNGLEEKAEVREKTHSQAQETTSQTAGEREERSRVSNENTKGISQTNPSHPTTQAERSKSEVPPVKDRPARRPLATGMSSIAEVIGKGRGTTRHERTYELPRMSAPPLTQEDLDKRKRERLAREQRAQNPLPGILNDSDWQKLEADHTTQTTTKSKRQPVYEKLQLAIERISEELGDFKHVTSNITQAENIRREAGADIEQFIVTLYDARYATKHAVTMGKVTKQDSTGQIVKMPYFYAVLRQKAGISKKQSAL